MKGLLIIAITVIGMMVISSCEPSAIEDEMGTRADTAQVQTVPIGMTITINTDWAGDTTIYYSKKR